MKKMININFQGRVIPIEETSFDILKNYIESLRVYFAKEEGRDEIINDIESRIAELFSERLKNTVCITDEDVNSIITGMGRPQDFEEAESTGNYNTGAEKPASASILQEAVTGTKLWRRSSNDSIIAGVCSGIAHYLKIDPAIVRVLFVILAFASFGFWLLVYILIWIILPEQQMTPNVRKRFYRSSDHRVFGGVAGGMAAYFSTDIWVPRLVFAAPLLFNILGGVLDFDLMQAFFGGFTAMSITVYIILWIILPEARTAAARLQMKGEEVNLQSIKNTIQEDPSPLVYQKTSGARDIGIVLGRLIILFLKALFLLTVGAIALALITALIVLLSGGMIGGSDLYPLKDFIIETPLERFLLLCTLILCLAIPAVALLTWLIRRIMGIRSKRHYLGYIFGCLWLLGIISAVVLAVTITRNFNTRETVEETVPLYYPVSGKLNVKVKSELSEYSKFRHSSRRRLQIPGMRGDSLFLNTVRIQILKSSDTSYHVHKLTSATGRNSQLATDQAMNIQYPIFQLDTSLVIPQGFTISNKAKFRNQQVEIVVEVPVGKKVEVNDAHSFGWFHIGFHNEDQDNGWRRGYRWKSGVEYVMTEDGLQKTSARTTK